MQNSLETDNPCVDLARYPMFPLAVLMAIGIAVGEIAEPDASSCIIIWAGGAVVFGIFFYFCGMNSRVVSVLILAGCLLLGFLRISLWKQYYLDKALMLQLPFTADELEGTVADCPDRSGTRPLLLEMRRIEVAGQLAPIRGRVQIHVPEQHSVSLQIGQRVRLTGLPLSPIAPRRNPGQFDLRAYLHGRGIVCQSFFAATSKLRILGEESASLPYRCARRVRLAVEDQLHSAFSVSGAAFMKAVLLGNKRALDDSILDSFRNTGTMHLLAISGLHVGFLAIAMLTLVSFLPIYFKQQNLLVIILLLIYMVVTGLMPSVVRSTTMAVLYLVAINFERRAAAANIFCAAAVAILLVQPQQLFWPGFQFSFAAVFGILYISPRIIACADIALAQIKSERGRLLLRNWLVLPAIISFCAQLATTPFSWYYFQMISPLGVVFNVVAVPLIGIIVMGGFLTLGLMLFSAPLAGSLAAICEIVIELIIRLLTAAADLPGASMNLPPFEWSNMFSLMLLAIAIGASLRQQARWVIYIIMPVLLLSGLAAFFSPAPLMLVLLDVGQGDAALVRTPAGKCIVVDVGPDVRKEIYEGDELLSLMRLQNIARVDFLFLSHPHMDHVGGLEGLLRKTEIGQAFMPPFSSKDQTSLGLVSKFVSCAVPIDTVSAGKIIRIDQHTHLYVLGPLAAGAGDEAAGSDDVNNRSLVFILAHRDQRILFTGDIEAEAEAALAGWGSELKADILKVAHHGSSSSSGAGFLKQVQPEIAVISMGKRNTFGHPSPDVLERLHRAGAEVHRTDRENAIWLRYGKGKWEQVDW